MAPYILAGLKTTLFYTATAFIGGMMGGSFLALAKISSVRVLRAFAVFYTSIFRGTPLILQLSFFYYASHYITGVHLAVWEAGVLAFSLNSSAYISEVLRGGIMSIEKGQLEAAHALSIPVYNIYKDIVLPQALRRSLPSLLNEVIDLLKESSLVSTITEIDIMRRASLVASQTHSFVEPFCIAAIIYYTMVMVLTTVTKSVEKRFAWH